MSIISNKVAVTSRLTGPLRNREARIARQARKPANSRRTRQASTNSPREASATESGSSEPESEQEEAEEQEEKRGLTQQPELQSHMPAPDANDTRPGLWKNSFEGNAFAVSHYDTAAIGTAHTNVLPGQYAPAEIFHQPSASQQYFDFQPELYQDLQHDFHQPTYDPSNGFAHGVFQPVHHGMPATQPSDYIMAMYENDLQPLGFTAGPPAGEYNNNYGVYDNGALPNVDFDMSHYEEALADVNGFHGNMGGAWQ